MTGLLFSQCEVGTLYFTPDVVRRFQRHRQSGPRTREAGGVLLGRRLLDCEDLIVDELTEPQRADRRTWSGFFRSLAHQALALRRWRQSGGTCAYLGSWHTHPEGDPRPSATDLTDWRHALHRDRYDGDALFFVIVGTQRTRVWQGHRAGEVLELQLIREA